MFKRPKPSYTIISNKNSNNYSNNKPSTSDKIYNNSNVKNELQTVLDIANTVNMIVNSSL